MCRDVIGGHLKGSDVPDTLAIYVHWPFCRSICPYCDFNVYAGARARAQAIPLCDAICVDLARWRDRIGPRRLVSVFLGGGTPSLAPTAVLERILGRIDTLFGLSAETEISLEANPDDWRRYTDFHVLGINRLSLGVQSLCDEELRFLGRNHDAATARRAVSAAFGCGARVSIDAIYALPGQSRRTWRRLLRELLSFQCEHLSLYQLTIAQRTPFGRLADERKLTPLDDGRSADLYAATQDMTEAHGLPAYEISSHATDSGAQSRHNLVYWRAGDWLGVGPGAHGRITLAAGTASVERLAIETARQPAAYITGIAKGSGACEETLTARQIRDEELLMNLRLSAGFTRPDGIDDEAIAACEAANLLRRDGDHLALTRSGRLMADRVAAMLSAS